MNQSIFPLVFAKILVNLGKTLFIQYPPIPGTAPAVI
jgi:hypothetical protein